MSKYRVLLLLAAAVIFLTSCQASWLNEAQNNKISSEEMLTLAKTTPFGKYPELVTYNLGNLTGINNSNMPEGDTYEDNAYTRFLRKILNVQNKNVFEAQDSFYDNVVSMAVSDNHLPDIMIVGDYRTLCMLVQMDAVEDLTQTYKLCASQKIKDIYGSYDQRALSAVTFDGKIMAIPGVNINYGPNLVWLRTDWLDTLGLSPPKTLADVENIALSFVEQNPGGNGEGETIGILCDSDLSGDYDLEYQMDLIFASYNAYPKKWVEHDGKIVYGSTTQSTKQALGHLRELYSNGILDNRFLLRTNLNMHDLIIDGKCGVLFGPWWAPNNPLMKSIEKDNLAEWKPYYIQTDSDGSCNTYSQPATNKYIVVKKGYEHPEAAVKIISVLFDFERYKSSDVTEIHQYYALNVDPTARPLSINVDYSDAYFKTSKQIKKALSGEINESSLSTFDKSYYDVCKEYLSTKNPTAEQWAAYASRVLAADELEGKDIKYITNHFEGQTETMQRIWWVLQQLEKESFLKIITGQEPLEYFDVFVSQWNSQGGETVTDEVNAQAYKD